MEQSRRHPGRAWRVKGVGSQDGFCFYPAAKFAVMRIFSNHKGTRSTRCPLPRHLPPAQSQNRDPAIPNPRPAPLTAAESSRLLRSTI